MTRDTSTSRRAGASLQGAGKTEYIVAVATCALLLVIAAYRYGESVEAMFTRSGGELAMVASSVDGAASEVGDGSSDPSGAARNTGPASHPAGDGSSSWQPGPPSGAQGGTGHPGTSGGASSTGNDDRSGVGGPPGANAPPTGGSADPSHGAWTNENLVPSYLRDDTGEDRGTSAVADAGGDAPVRPSEEAQDPADGRGRPSESAPPVPSLEPEEPSIPDDYPWMVSSPDGDDLANGFNGQIGANTPNQSGIIGNAAELAQTVYAGYNNAEYGPISIIPVDVHGGDYPGPTYLVTISGTELVRGQSTGIFTDIKMGLNQNNHLSAAVRKAIKETIPKGSNIILAGHSLGGMVAQHVSANGQIKKDYNVTDVITFGSPLISLGRREGHVKRFADRADAVPGMSVDSAVLSLVRPFTEIRRFSGTINPLAAHSSYTNEEVWGDRDALGNDDGNITITFEPRERAFFTAPYHVEEGPYEGPRGS